MTTLLLKTIPERRTIHIQASYKHGLKLLYSYCLLFFFLPALYIKKVLKIWKHLQRTAGSQPYEHKTCYSYVITQLSSNNNENKTKTKLIIIVTNVQREKASCFQI